jgi:hypothetical protein
MLPKYYPTHYGRILQTFIEVRFVVFTAVTMKKALTDALRADFLIFPLDPEDGGDAFLRNVG